MVAVALTFSKWTKTYKNTSLAPMRLKYAVK